MPLPNLPWNTVTPTNQDTIETVGSNQPDLTNDSTPGANDGHRVLVEHVHALRNKLQNAYLEIGTNPGNEPTSSLRYRVAQLEAGAGTDEKTKISADDDVQGYLNDKIAAGTGIAKTVLNPAGNEQLELSVSGLLAVDFNEEFFETTTETAGTDVYKVLTNTPNLATVSLSGRALDVYRNGKRMKYDATPTAYDEYNYESGANRIHVKASGSADEYEVVYITGGTPTPANFLDLGDVPSAYTGEGGKVVKVAGSEDGLVFEAASVGSHASSHESAGGDTVDHNQLVNAVGTQSHATIDAHLSSTANPHSVDASDVGNTTAQWNANQLQDRDVQDVAPTDGYVLTWNQSETRWEPAAAGAPSTHASSHESAGGDTVDHNQLVNAVGTQSHATIDTHLSSSANPHSVDASDVGNTTAQWNANQLQDRDVQDVAPTDGYVLKWNQSQTRWEPAAESGGGSHASSHESAGGDTVDHNQLVNAVGTQSHATIDTHLSSTSNPHSVDASDVGNTTAQWNANQLQGRDVQNVAPTDGYVLKWNQSETRWEPAAESGGGGGDTPHEEVWTSPGTDSLGDIIVFKGTGTALNATPRGSGTADTESGYDLQMFCNGIKMTHNNPPTSTDEYYYDSANNEIDLYASGDEDRYQAVYGS